MVHFSKGMTNEESYEYWGKLSCLGKKGLPPEKYIEGLDKPPPKGEDPSKAYEADYKLRSPQFRAKVRLVLEWLGEPMTMGKYRELDGVIDWSAMAESIENPTLSAICHMTDEAGQIVAIEGVPVTFLEEIPAKHKDNPNKWLQWKGRSKVWVKWWLSCLALLIFTSCSYTPREKLALGAMLGAGWADYATTTRYIDIGGTESNPFLNNKPSHGDVLMFKVAQAGIAIIVGEIWPEHREGIFWTVAAISGGAAVYNDGLYERYK